MTVMGQPPFSTNILGKAAWALVLDALRPDRLYRPRGIDTILVCFTRLLYDESSSGTAMDRSQAARWR